VSSDHPEIGGADDSPPEPACRSGPVISPTTTNGTTGPLSCGLQGQGIPLFAAIGCLTQEFDHLMTDHHTSPPLSLEEAVAEVRVKQAPVSTRRSPELFTRVGHRDQKLPFLAGNPSRRTTTPDH